MADETAENVCDPRHSQCLKVFEIAEFELNLSEGPFITPSWIEDIQICGVKFEISNP